MSIPGKEKDFLEAHLNVAWLRPESAFWDAIASAVISRYSINSPSLDLGCGNGIFSFITAGGRFSLDYDWYINTDTERFGKNNDIYDAYLSDSSKKAIIKRPLYNFDVGFDVKINLLRQVMALGFYADTVAGNAVSEFCFKDETFKTVFSNILYWINNPRRSLKKIFNILQSGGEAILCVPDKKF